MSSVPQFTRNDNFMNNLSLQEYKLQRKPSNNNHTNQFTILVSVIYIITVIYFQIQIYSLKKTISSLFQVDRSLQFSTHSGENQYDDRNFSNSRPNNQLDLRASSIITTSKQIKFVHKLFGSFLDIYKLIYKASYFGDSFDSLHNVLYKEENTLIIIETENGEIIGGYSKMSLVCKSQCIFLDVHSNSFTFDVNAENKQSIYISWDDFCIGILSLSYDLVLYDNFMSSEENYYDFSMKNSKYKNNHSDINHIKFKVKEMEIFKVIRSHSNLE